MWEREVREEKYVRVMEDCEMIGLSGRRVDDTKELQPRWGKVQSRK